VTVTSGDIDLRTRIDDFFRTSFATDNPLITEAIRRMLAAGGKRLRPRLTLLAAQAAGGNVEEHLPIAAYMELIHVATLIHDDVVDQADTRRGVNATAVDFGNRISVLAGDYLFAWIFKNVTADYLHPIPHILSATLAAICDGEVLQLRSLDNTELDMAGYREIVTKKTASLFAASARCGAIAGGGSPEIIEALTRFGELFGIAFQMIDDLLDFVAEQAEVGKPVGHDLVEHKVTLPVISALAVLDEQQKEPLLRYYGGDDAALESAIRTVSQHAALERSRSMLDEALDEALAALAPLPKDAHPSFAALVESVRR
jgi:geranylgeranyl pyrophosphate synthase